MPTHFNDVVRFGTPDSYAQFGTDGSLRLIGTATTWDDLLMPLVSGKRGATDKPDFDFTNVGFLFPQNDATEIIYLTAQMPHRWKQGSKIYPHLHWRQSSATRPTWKIDYAWFNIGAAPAVFQTATLDAQVETYTSGDLHQIDYLTNGITATGKTLSSMILIKLYRQDNALTGDALAYQFDIHLEIDSLGSETEYAKV